MRTRCSYDLCDASVVPVALALAVAAAIVVVVPPGRGVGRGRPNVSNGVNYIGLSINRQLQHMIIIRHYGPGRA